MFILISMIWLLKKLVELPVATLRDSHNYQHSLAKVIGFLIQVSRKWQMANGREAKL